MKSDNQQRKVVWSSQNVANWLISNGWSSLVNVFNDYNIHHDRFLNLTGENVNELLKDMNISTADKERLINAIQKLKVEDHQVLPQRPRIAIPSYQTYSSHRNSDSSINTTTSTNSSSTPLLMSHSNNLTTTTPTTPNGFDISQYIPKRTSSSDTNVSKMLENFHPTISKSSSILTKPKSPRINAADPDVLIKLFGKRLPVPSPRPQDSRIQVTLDADTFVRLWIKYDSSALDIKHAILYKLCVEADPMYFHFYHENGRNSSKPLVDEELVFICTTSNDSQTNRILVLPQYGYELIRQQLHSSIRYVLSSSSPMQSPISYSTNGGVQLVDPETPKEEGHHDLQLSDLTPVKTSLSSSDLWAAQPTSADTRRPSASISPWHTNSPLWPVGDQRSEVTHAQPMERRVEGISLYDPPTPVHDIPPGDFPTSPVDSPPSPVHSEKRPPSQKSGDSSRSVQQPSEEDMFGERPTVEKLYRDIDKYLPGHDLDKEILVDSLQQPQQQQPQQQQIQAPAPVPVPAIPSTVSRRLLGHRQSVRVVAKEAHRRWKQAANNVMVVNSLMLRRKSTKMWDRPVERVKPGEENRIEPLSSMTPTKMQWMRGNLIGRGSFGRVYHALNIATGDWLAVKQVDAVVTQSDKLNADLQAASDALYQEIVMLKDLDHENIVQYMGYDSNVEEGHIYIFLEYVPGGSISSLLSQYKFFDEPLTKFFTKQILQGLQYLHERHILHRDIKGGNVLIDQNGVCKITDFGLSKNQQDSGIYDPHSNHSQMKGTLYWMAPEVLTNNYSAKVDVWSLGCTVLEMITGEHPWMELTTLAALYQIGLHNAPAIPENISPEAKDFLQQCLKIKPEDRPTATELLQHPFLEQDPNFDFKESLKNQQPKH